MSGVVSHTRPHNQGGSFRASTLLSPAKPNSAQNLAESLATGEASGIDDCPGLLGWPPKFSAFYEVLEANTRVQGSYRGKGIKNTKTMFIFSFHYVTVYSFSQC